MTTLAPLFLALLPTLPQEAPPTGAFYRVALRELALDGTLPATPARFTPWSLPPSALMPRAILDGEGEVWITNDEGAPAPGAIDPAAGFLVARTDAPRDLSGTLFFPDEEWRTLVRLRFEIPASRADASAEDLARATASHYRQLLQHRIPGAAWFRHRLAELEGSASEDAGEARRDAESDLQATLGLVSGGRALGENLQLDRLLPPTDGDGEEVALATLEGITVRAFDWGPLLGEEEPAFDPLAALVPADQHAIFFPSFDALARVIDEASSLGEPLLTVFEQGSEDAGTRERYERQLCLPLDAVARAFGPLAVRSVVFTGSDAYLRTGSDVAVLMEAVDADALVAFVRARQRAGATDESSVIEVVHEGLSVFGVQTPGRVVSSYVATVNGFVCVSNSITQLERVIRVAAGGAPALTSAPEYRFFRQRYPRGAEEESALVLVPDEAIRRWCGPRWRIAASRRTRAAALFAELTAAHADELAAGAPGGPLPADARFPMGDLALGDGGVRSSVYGRLGFETPVAELELDKVSAREAELYRRWRDGYQANWSAFFDPIALRVSVAPDALAADLTVMPLIADSDYRELVSIVGDARLSPTSGDPHADALAHWVMALDPEGELVRQGGMIMSGMLPSVGAEALNWLGGALSVWLDESPFVEELMADGDRDAARDELFANPNEIPLVLWIESRSPLKLAAFLGAVRAYSELTAPGLVQWTERASGEHRYVEIGSDMVLGDDRFSLWYAATPRALLLALNEAALVRALDRDAARRADGAAAAPAIWADQSFAFRLTRDGLRALGTVQGEDVGAFLRERSWDNLPILNEWRRRYPERDPVALHAALWGTTLYCPGGGTYVWNEADRTLESTVYGHPRRAERRPGPPAGARDAREPALRRPLRARRAARERARRALRAGSVPRGRWIRTAARGVSRLAPRRALRPPERSLSGCSGRRASTIPRREPRPHRRSSASGRGPRCPPRASAP